MFRVCAAPDTSTSPARSLYRQCEVDCRRLIHQKFGSLCLVGEAYCRSRNRIVSRRNLEEHVLARSVRGGGQCLPFALSVIETFAPGTSAPFGSLMMPRSEVLAFCATAKTAVERIPTSIHPFRECLTALPPEVAVCAFLFLFLCRRGRYGCQKRRFCFRRDSIEGMPLTRNKVQNVWFPWSFGNGERGYRP